MSDRSLWQVPIGTSVSFVIGSALTDDITGYSCAAKVRRLPGGRNSYTPSSTIAATPVVTTFAGDAERGDGWTVALDDEVTAALKAGIYQVDADLTFAGNVVERIEWLLEVQN